MVAGHRRNRRPGRPRRRRAGHHGRGLGDHRHTAGFLRRPARDRQQHGRRDPRRRGHRHGHRARGRVVLMMSQPSWDTRRKATPCGSPRTAVSLFTVFGRCSSTTSDTVPRVRSLRAHRDRGVDVTGVSARVDASTDTGEIRRPTSPGDHRGERYREDHRRRLGPRRGDQRHRRDQPGDFKPPTSGDQRDRCDPHRFGLRHCRVRSDTGAITVTTDTEFRPCMPPRRSGTSNCRCPTGSTEFDRGHRCRIPKVAVDQSRDATSVIEAQRHRGHHVTPAEPAAPPVHRPGRTSDAHRPILPGQLGIPSRPHQNG